MPAIPVICQKIKDAKVREIVKVRCHFRGCQKEGTFLIALRYSDGATDLFGVCSEHKGKTVEMCPGAFDLKVKEQTFFVY